MGTSDIFVGSGQLIKSGDMSGNLTSQIMDLGGKFDLAVQMLSESGTRAGTLAIQGSVNGTDWSTIASVTATAGAALSHVEDVTTNCPWARVIYTDTTSGTGAGGLNIYVHRKMR